MNQDLFDLEVRGQMRFLYGEHGARHDGNGVSGQIQCPESTTPEILNIHGHRSRQSTLARPYSADKDSSLRRSSSKRADGTRGTRISSTEGLIPKTEVALNYLSCLYLS